MASFERTNARLSRASDTQTFFSSIHTICNYYGNETGGTVMKLYSDGNDDEGNRSHRMDDYDEFALVFAGLLSRQGGS